MQEFREPGRRERKRFETSRAIHRAAAELVLENGIEATTIDAISARADVSPRTFFNYFPSKEDAVLGFDEAAVSAELEVEREYSGDPIAAVFELVFALFAAGGGSTTKSELKRRVLTKHPELLSRQMTRIATLEDRMTEKVAELLANDPRFATENDATRLDEARVVLTICLGTIRADSRKRASERDPEAGDSEPPTPQETHDRTLAMLRTVLEKIK